MSVPTFVKVVMTMNVITTPEGISRIGPLSPAETESEADTKPQSASLESRLRYHKNGHRFYKEKYQQSRISLLISRKILLGVALLLVVAVFQISDQDSELRLLEAKLQKTEALLFGPTSSRQK